MLQLPQLLVKRRVFGVRMCVNEQSKLGLLLLNTKYLCQGQGNCKNCLAHRHQKTPRDGEGGGKHAGQRRCVIISSSSLHAAEMDECMNSAVLWSTTCNVKSPHSSGYIAAQLYIYVNVDAYPMLPILEYTHTHTYTPIFAKNSPSPLRHK